MNGDPMDLRLDEIIAVQAKWSAETFGPGCRLNGLIDHIRKELDEIEKDPTDVMEFIDVAVLAFDGAWRLLQYGACHPEIQVPRRVAEAYWAKIKKNMDRRWPDWRTAEPDKAIEHIRGGEDG